MESLLENKALLYSLAASTAFLLGLVTGAAPDLNKQFEIVLFESEVSWFIHAHNLMFCLFGPSLKRED